VFPVGAVQFKARRGDKAKALAQMRRLIVMVAPKAELVVLPEMAATGYLFDSPVAVGAVAEPRRGETFLALAPLAREHACWLVVGFAECDGGRYFNSALIIDPKGELHFTYRKTMLYDADTPWATPGDSGYRRVDTDSGSFVVGICMDLNDDGFVRWCANAKPRAIAMPTNWLDEGHDVWPYWAWRVKPTGAALIAANTWGNEGDIGFSGRSLILDGRRALAGAPREGNGVIRAELGESPGIMAS
jgi:predicted amidohydrolase